MRKSTLELLREEKQREHKTVEVAGPMGMYHLLLSGGDPAKPPNPTQIDLLMAEEEMLAYMGIAGGGKTSALCAVIWMLLLFRGGYKAFIARKDYNDLADSTMLRMEEMLYRLPEGTLVDRSRKPPEKWWIRAINGEISTVTFLGLNEKPKSKEYHGGGIDEADEVEKEIADEMQLRARLPGHNCRIILAFNPTDEDHWIYEACTGLNSKGEKVVGVDGQPIGPIYRLIMPKPGENNHNVKPGYYESKRRTLSPDLYQRMIEGKWGSSIRGTPVFGANFKRSWHANDLLDFNPYMPLMFFHDFGYRHPVCLWAQPTPLGGLNILWELSIENTEIHDWVPLIQAETRTRFPDANPDTHIHWGDPAARQHKDTGSTLAVLNQLGIILRFRIGGKTLFDDGIRAIRMLLSRSFKGVPALRIDKRCTILIRALEKGYRYPEEKEKGSTRKGVPLKDGYFDNFIDPLRYGIFGHYGPLGAAGNQWEAFNDMDASEDPVILPPSTMTNTWGRVHSVAYTNAGDPQKNRMGR